MSKTPLFCKEKGTPPNSPAPSTWEQQMPARPPAPAPRVLRVVVPVQRTRWRRAGDAAGAGPAGAGSGGLSLREGAVRPPGFVFSVLREVQPQGALRASVTRSVSFWHHRVDSDVRKVVPGASSGPPSPSRLSALCPRSGR